jgi:hypothetical protein
LKNKLFLGWSAPAAISTGGVGGGFQVGAELSDFVIVLNNHAAVKAFTKGNVTLGGNLSVAAGPIGRNAEAAGAATLAAIFSYSRTRGLFAGVSLEGSVLVERKEANAKLYGHGVTAAALLSGHVPPPPAARPLYDALSYVDSATGFDQPNSYGGGPGGFNPNQSGSYPPHSSGYHSTSSSGNYPPPSGGYPPPPSGGYPPPPSSSYSSQNRSISSSGGYPPPGQGYPPPSQGYPPPGQGYPPPGQGYPPPGQGYPPPDQNFGDVSFPLFSLTKFFFFSLIINSFFFLS